MPGLNPTVDPAMSWPSEIPPVPISLVTVVIPTYNRVAELRRALLNLARQPGPPLHAVVVDNSSSDGTAAMVAELEPAWSGRLRYLRKAPQGPASARNAGLALAGTEFVLFQDSDVELGEGWIVRALARMQADADLGAVGGRIVYAFDPGRVNAYGGELNWFGLAWDVDEGQVLPAATEPPAAAQDRVWINCSAMLVRRTAALAAGAFDERFFYGYEDTDLGWRLRIAGQALRVVPELVARHHVEAATGPAHPDIVFHACKNRLRMLLRNVQARRLPWVLGGYLGYTALDLLLHGPRAPKWRALLWNWRHAGETLALRAATQARRRCADAEILACGSGRWFPPTRLRGQRRRAVASGLAITKGSSADDRV